MNTLELLAPAKDFSTGITAINCGADAVYIGAPKFSARSAAGNTIQDIEQLVHYAHRYWAKVYVALNTILTDCELEEAVALTHQLQAIGVDALIIQDMGLLESPIAPLPLFASTQCDNRTPEKVKFLEDCGFKRVILARELSLAEMQNIRSATTIGLEAFVHGALCVCYSGQCYLSYAIGGRSANRGTCAQPCRKLFSLKTADGKMLATDQHLLSLRDLNLITHLGALAAAGVTSFKIEGRLKDQVYVKNVVSAYRQALDKVIVQDSYQKASSGTVDFAFTPDLVKTFNREYTRFNIDGTLQDYTSFETPNHRGEIIAIADVHPADGISYYDSEGVLQGAYANTIILNPQMTMYRNYDYQFHKALGSAKTTRRIGIDVMVNDAGFVVTDENGNSVSINWPNTYEIAQKEAQAIATIEKQLSKLGDTEFQVRTFANNLSQPVFIPVRELNELRRSAIDQLRGLRLSEHRQNSSSEPISPTNHPYPDHELDFRANALNAKAKLFYQRHGVTLTEISAEAGVPLKGKPVMTTKHCLKRCFGLCLDPVNLILVDDKGKEYPLEFDCPNCTMSIIF